jgi:O-antigen/teichoic acid export membrane protein
VLRETTGQGRGEQAGAQEPGAIDAADVDARPTGPGGGSALRDSAGRLAGALPAQRPTGSEQVEDLRARQEAGLSALFAIAAQVSFAMSEAATAKIPAFPGRLPEHHVTAPPPRVRTVPEQGAAAVAEAAPRRAGLLGQLRADHLVRNSLYLMLSSGIQAGLGFTFWIIMTRLFGADDVGRAGSLISATSLIAYFALFGLNSTLDRFLPTAPDKGRLITSGFILVICAGAIIGLGYILLTPVIAPRLAFVAHSPLLTAGFVLLAAAAAVNLLTDSVFIASRKAGLCALTDGVVGGLSKIVLGLVLVGSGAYGLFAASAAGFAVSALASIVLIVTVLHWRPSVRRPFQALRPLLRFSGASYLANAMTLLPNVAVPLIVLDRLGSKPAGYYFVAFQIALLLYAAVYAVEASFLAEGSQAGADWRKIRRRSRRLAVILFVPGGAALALAAHWVLLAFGVQYSLNAAGSLEMLAVAVLPIAACNWAWTVLRLAGRLGGLVFSSAVYAVGICGTAWVLAPRGLTVLAAAWPVGAALAGAAASVCAAMVTARAPARHRKTAHGHQGGS